MRTCNAFSIYPEGTGCSTVNPRYLSYGIPALLSLSDVHLSRADLASCSEPLGADSDFLGALSPPFLHPLIRLKISSYVFLFTQRIFS